MWPLQGAPGWADQALMTRRLMIAIAACALFGLLAIPSSSGAATSAAQVNQLSAAYCKGENKALGKKAFAKRYGKKGMKACVKKQRKTVRAAYQAATEECQAELDEFGEEEFYFEWESFEECVDWYADEELNPSPEGDDPIGDDDPTL